MSIDEIIEQFTKMILCEYKKKSCCGDCTNCKFYINGSDKIMLLTASINLMKLAFALEEGNNDV